MPGSAARVFALLNTPEPPDHTPVMFGRAVVLGGSIAGLLAAPGTVLRVLRANWRAR